MARFAHFSVVILNAVKNLGSEPTALMRCNMRDLYLSGIILSDKQHQYHENDGDAPVQKPVFDADGRVFGVFFRWHIAQQIAVQDQTQNKPENETAKTKYYHVFIINMDCVFVQDHACWHGQKKEY